ncbi:uncharacterized protein IL334_005135 [Kwoniella shivajii]|uniref:Zn(2)-C6 fungal-type domain-containing protein n=1 Tax=Kwoniella shivajii TaxID=564305 RepID=A0ABZ1D2P0_9TREE|nr:hypothetical protein IL334_005135 [Kwoniella shivajii]
MSSVVSDSRVPGKVCDWCRTQKVKCQPMDPADEATARQSDLGGACQRCYRRKQQCTFTYTMKRPGRPSTIHARAHDSRSASPSPVRGDPALRPPQISPTVVSNDQQHFPHVVQAAVAPDEAGAADYTAVISNVLPSDTVRPSDLVDALLRQSTPQFNFPPDHLATATLPLNIADWASAASLRLPDEPAPGNDPGPSNQYCYGTPASSSQLMNAAPSEPDHQHILASVSEPGGFMPIDVVAPWSDPASVSFCKPGRCLTMSRSFDAKRSNAFLVAYVISQSPMGIMGGRHPRERLKRILFRAHRFSRACQLRNSHQPTLAMLASVILDLISTQATDDSVSTDMLAAEARRLVYTLRINRSEPREGMNLIEREISHRMFWEVVAIEKWVEQALEETRSLMVDVPVTESSPSADFPSGTADQSSWWGIQCANIHITALCTRFACIDFRSALMPSFDTPSQRELIAKEAYRMLIPIDCLASNGQSLRGKILRVVLSLLSMSSESSDMGAHVWDWWNLYHNVQFVQAMPEVTQ